MSDSSEALFSGDDGGAATAAVTDDREMHAGGGNAALPVHVAGDSIPQPPQPSWSTIPPMSDNYYG